MKIFVLSLFLLLAIDLLGQTKVKQYKLEVDRYYYGDTSYFDTTASIRTDFLRYDVGLWARIIGVPVFLPYHFYNSSYAASTRTGDQIFSTKQGYEIISPSWSFYQKYDSTGYVYQYGFYDQSYDQLYGTFHFTISYENNRIKEINRLLYNSTEKLVFTYHDDQLTNVAYYPQEGMLMLWIRVAPVEE